MKQYIKDNFESLGYVVAIAVSVAYGLSGMIDFGKGTAIFIPLALAVYHILNKPDKVAPEADLTELVEGFQGILDEQEQVIKDYENIFDLQLVELPCVCGGNTFQGLFSPKTENIVECEKCKNKYRVNISYEAVLISEPLDINQTFDNLVGGIN